jgi:LPS O-antigen subunit length determinant protein (WzzB/FepE family)
MKTKPILFLVVLSTALALMAASCVTSKEKQTTALLTQAGFKILPASDFEKQEKLKTIQAGQVSTIKGADGELYYVYPVHAQDLLYVGRSAEFTNYQTLLHNQQVLTQNLKAERAARAAAKRERQTESTSGNQSSWEEVWSAPH